MTEQEAFNDSEMKTILVLSGYVRELGEGKDYEETTFKTAETIVKIFSIHNVNFKRIMKKDIIISGPVASGKSWIASAIEKTHPKIALRTMATGLNKALEEKRITRQTLENRSLIIIDECTKKDIIDLDMRLRTFLIDEFGNDQYPIVYLTQEDVTQQDFQQGLFQIINCRNAHL